MKFFVLVLYFLATATPDSSWWLKPEYQTKIREQRQVIVSIKSEKVENKSFFNIESENALNSL